MSSSCEPKSSEQVLKDRLIAEPGISRELREALDDAAQKMALQIRIKNDLPRIEMRDRQDWVVPIEICGAIIQVRKEMPEWAREQLDNTDLDDYLKEILGSTTPDKLSAACSSKDRGNSVFAATARACCDEDETCAIELTLARIQSMTSLISANSTDFVVLKALANSGNKSDSQRKQKQKRPSEDRYAISNAAYLTWRAAEEKTSGNGPLVVHPRLIDMHSDLSTLHLMRIDGVKTPLSPDIKDIVRQVRPYIQM